MALGDRAITTRYSACALWLTFIVRCFSVVGYRKFLACTCIWPHWEVAYLRGLYRSGGNHPLSIFSEPRSRDLRSIRPSLIALY